MKLLTNRRSFMTMLAVLMAAVWYLPATEVRAAGAEGEEKDTTITISAAGDCTLGSDRSSPPV